MAGAYEELCEIGSTTSGVRELQHLFGSCQGALSGSLEGYASRGK